MTHQIVRGIGVLAIQGNFASHAQALCRGRGRAVRGAQAGAIAGLDGLILPGGESTTMLKFLEKRGFFEALKEFCAYRPVFGTCAGAILLAREVLQSAAALIWACWTQSWSAMPTAGRSTPPFLLPKPRCPAARWRWSSFARRALWRPAPGRGACPARGLSGAGSAGRVDGRHLSSRTLRRPARAPVICRDRNAAFHRK